MFNPSRLTHARVRRGLSKKRLAEMSAVSLRSLHQYESGDVVPSAPVLDALSQTLRFPHDFFSRETLEVPEPNAVTFRALTSMTGAKRGATLVAGAIAVELFRWIEERFTLPAVDVPESMGLGPEACAEMVRESWGLGTGPVRNVLHALEFNGVRICSLPEEHAEVDAFSLWRDSTPYVFLNTLKSGERGRFDAAHELGHLVMHRGVLPDARDREVEAQRFAAAFLMPRSSLSVARGLPTLDRLVELKGRWGVSVAALAHRLYEVGYVSEWTYRMLCIQISQAGYRKKEPRPMARESSQILEKVLRSLRSKGKSRRDVAAALGLTPDELSAFVFNLAMTTIDGGAAGVSDGVRLPELTIVEGGLR